MVPWGILMEAIERRRYEGLPRPNAGWTWRLIGMMLKRMTPGKRAKPGPT